MSNRMRGRPWQNIRERVLARDGAVCRGCGDEGEPSEMHIDHIVPIAAGGSNDLENLQVLCGPCNRAKGASLAPRQNYRNMKFYEPVKK